MEPDMTTFRILDPFPTYLDLAGNLAVGGSLKFYDTGTTNPRDVYGDQAKAVNNGSSVEIGTDGRPVHDIWGDGAYRVRLYAADGTLIDEADDVQIEGGNGTAIPALVPNQFLTNDGATMQWGDVRQVPDPTGNSGKVLGNDGAVLTWQAPPAAVTPDITITANSMQVGASGSPKFLIQAGSDSAPASGTVKASKSITFAKAFSTLLHVSITPTSNSQPGGPVVAYTTAQTPTGFTVEFDIAEGNASSANFVNPAPFTWVAFGTVPEVPPVSP